MIITVTLNPAIDKTVEINDVQINQVNRVSSVRLDAGGKGINVSKIILSLGGKSRAIGFLGGKAGEFIKEYLDAMGIENEFVFINGETRTNLKIVDPIQHSNTDINEQGPEITLENIKQIDHYIAQSVTDQSVVVFSGSVPPNVAKDSYQKWIYSAKQKGAKTLLDADGELLRLGIEAGPYLIKPNIHELESLFARKIASMEEAVVCSRSMIEKYGIAVVVISMGEKGALFVNKAVALLAEGIAVTVKSTVGAGDAMVAALAYALDEGYAFEKAAILAVAAGTANVMTCGTEPGSLKVIEKLKEAVKWNYL
jgi:1-phosphofructokinase